MSRVVLPHDLCFSRKAAGKHAVGAGGAIAFEQHEAHVVAVQSAAIAAQNPAGSVRPPLPGSQGPFFGCCCAQTAAPASTRARAVRVCFIEAP